MSRFEPGKSGNPGGRPKVVGEVVELARKHTAAAIETLARIATDKDAPPAAQVRASEVLLDRGWGKPLQQTEVSGPDGEAIFKGITISFVAPTD